MPSVPLIVIGGSAGALEPLRTLFAGLPATLPAAVLVVVHRPPGYHSYLADILGRCGPLPVRDAVHGEPIVAGRAYVAPPGHHLIVARHRVTLSRGPKERHARPSIDVLFRSAALSAGGSVLGVLLSGRLDDGSCGLGAIQRLGGVTLVQHPEDAECPEMPLGALRRGEADETVRTARLADRVVALAQRLGVRAERPGVSEDERRRLRFEAGVAAEDPAFDTAS